AASPSPTLPHEVPPTLLPVEEGEPGCSSSQSVREVTERDFKTAEKAQERISSSSSSDDEEEE
ncbi:Nuclear receptor corepressor 2, partial [Clarias magur]